MSLELIAKKDPEVFAAMQQELNRQQTKLELIASENFVDESVLEAAGSVLTNKYAEGLPGKRYYGGCEYVDVVENIAIERAKQIFKADHVNVQPHCGAQANEAAYFALMKPGDKILGLDLSHGGHLSHGMKINLSGRFYESHFYQVDPMTCTLDYDQLERVAEEVKPQVIVAGASAYPRFLDYKRFREICDRVGAYLVVDMAHIAGLIAVGLHPDPVPYADIVTTTTHKTLRGPRGGMILCKEEHAKKVNSAVFPGIQGGPLMHIIAAKAVAFGLALAPEFKQYQEQVVKNAQSLATSLLNLDLDLVSGGTDTHLMLVDLRKTGVSGKVLQERLDEVNITCNKNGIPFDPEKPTITSGIRLGTPAVTTRGLKEADMAQIAKIIKLAITDFEKNTELCREMVAAICEQFPLYASLS